MTKHDKESLALLLDACRRNYSYVSDRFVAFDEKGQACVILHFVNDDATDIDGEFYYNFATCRFSSLNAAMQAFLKIEERLGEIGDYYAEKTDCPIWQYRAKKISR